MELRIILASKSPRRREILEQIGVRFECMHGDKEEIITKELPEDIVCELSAIKASDIEEKLSNESDSSENILIIGADTIVSNAGKILGKPKDKEDAFNMIKSLQGHAHQVFTGVTVIYICKNEKFQFTFAEKTDVKVSKMSDSEILSYVETLEPMDKAGGYGIQGRFGAYIERISGDYYNVVGLPVSRLYHEVNSRLGIVLNKNETTH